MKNIQLKIITINLYVATDPIPTRACGVCRFTSFLFRQKNYKNYAFLALEKNRGDPRYRMYFRVFVALCEFLEAKRQCNITKNAKHCSVKA